MLALSFSYIKLRNSDTIVNHKILTQAYHGALKDQIDSKPAKKDNFQYQKYQKTTRCGFFDVVV